MKESMNISEIRSTLENRVVTLPDGATIPVIGQGTWYMGENKRAMLKMGPIA